MSIIGLLLFLWIVVAPTVLFSMMGRGPAMRVPGIEPVRRDT